MASNYIVQISIVGVIVLGALVAAIIKIIKLSKKQGDCGCGNCAASKDCAAKELTERSRRFKNECRDGQSARN